MSSGSRTFLIAFGVAVLLLCVVVGSVAVSVQRCGMLRVEVHDWSNGGEHISIRLPGAVVPVAVQFVPDDAFGEMPSEICQMAPLLRDILDELAEMPDFVMVEVYGGDEHVVIAKRGRNLVIDVEEASEEVHVTVPLATMRSVIKRLEKLEGTSAPHWRTCSDLPLEIVGGRCERVVVRG